MDVPLAIVFLGFLIFFSHFLNSMFDKTNIPNPLLLLIIGLIIGPVGQWVSPGDLGAFGPVFTTLTLIILLFESGVNLKITSLKGAIGPALLVTIFNFAVSSLISAVIAYYFTDIDEWVSAAFFGVIVGGTSSAVVIPIVKQLRMNEAAETILVLESALSDVLCLVIGLGLLSAMESGIFEFKPLLWTVSTSFILAAVIGVITGLIWSVLLNAVRRLHNYTFTNLAMAFVVAGVSDLLGLNGGIATLAFGITLGNAYVLKYTTFSNFFDPENLSETEKSFLSEIVFIFQTYFFVYVGVSIRFGDPVIFLLALLIVVLILAARPPSIYLFVRYPLSLKELSIMSVMSPKGLVPAILASLPLQLGIVNGLIIQDLAYAVVVLSILICAIAVAVISKRKGSFFFFNLFFMKKANKNSAIQKNEKQNIVDAG